MKLRDYIFDDIEGKHIKKFNAITNLIVNEIENKYNTTIPCDNYVDILFVLLMSQYQYEVKKLMIKYSYNKDELLFSILSLLCINDESFEQDYIDIFNLFFEDYQLKKVNNYYLLIGPYGSMTIERFINCVDDEYIKELVNSGICRNQCHSVSGVLGQELLNSKIITSIMPGRFGENYFHSYLLVNDSVIDVSNNTVYSKAGFYNYFKPIEILNYPSSELEERYENLKEHSTDAKTLQLALEKLKEKY